MLTAGPSAIVPLVNARSFLFALVALSPAAIVPMMTTACDPAASAPPAAPTVSNAEGGVDSTGTIRYLALGDSLTQGVSGDNFEAYEAQSFPIKLAAKWRAQGCKVEVKNAGISGYTAAQVLSDQVPQIAEFKPSFITFQSGANDIANGVTQDAYRSAVQQVIAAAKKSGARVVVLLQNEWFRAPAGPGYGGTAEKRAAYDEIMLDEIKKGGAELADLRLLYRQDADANQWVSDGIHPTASAYESWANELARIIPAPCK